MISVCLATYNGAGFVHKQISSILDQLGPADELIVSDDNSTDATLDIVMGVQDDRIKLIHNNLKKGLVSNFENALNHAKGNYVFLSDQDDVWLPDKVNHCVGLLAEYDLVLSDCIVVNQHDSVVWQSFFRHRGSKPGFLNNLYKNSYMGCCMAFRREVLTYVLPFPKAIHVHDWWIGLMVEVRGKPYFTNKPLINYVKHGGNATPTGEKGYGLMRQLRERASLFWAITNRFVFNRK